MQEGRTFYQKRRSMLILDKRFQIHSELNVGDVGQAIVDGVIESERIDSTPDGDETVKTVYVNNIKPAIDRKESRV